MPLSSRCRASHSSSMNQKDALIVVLGRHKDVAVGMRPMHLFRTVQVLDSAGTSKGCAPPEGRRGACWAAWVLEHGL